MLLYNIDVDLFIPQTDQSNIMLLLVLLYNTDADLYIPQTDQSIIMLLLFVGVLLYNTNIKPTYVPECIEWFKHHSGISVLVFPSLFLVL